MNPASKSGYHHGDLRDALVSATDRILIERGLEGFSLREAARRAGVSAGAPAHHFGSVSGLLTEVAIRGFEELVAFLRAGEAEGGTDPLARLHGQGTGYVRFAVAFPGRFALMFRKDRLDDGNEHLKQVGETARHELERAMAACLGRDVSSPHVALAAMGAWSLVHGFAHLALDGKLGGPAAVAAAIDDMLPHLLAMYRPDREQPGDA